MNDPRGLQAGFNAGSRDQWVRFADHRRVVSALLGAIDDPRPTRLCVLGAGNGNDLDLPALLEAHREVHLVDLDPEALGGAVDRQGVAENPRLHRHGGLDVTGMLDVMARWSPIAPISGSDLEALVDWPARRVGLALPGPFDMVASTCLLSQLVGNAYHSIGENHFQFLDVVRAIRLGHLRLLAHLAGPRGVILLISDVVSSDWFPSLVSMEDSALPALLPRLAAEGGLIHGVNPLDIVELFRRDPILSTRRAGLEVVPPWRWKLHERTYLVWAIRSRGPALKS